MPTVQANARDHARREHQPHTNGTTLANDQNTGTADNGEHPMPGNGLGALIAEAQALRDYLHDGFARAGKLCVSLKKHRKQFKLAAATLASLRQLQQVQG
jgi:hypothetical protein